MTKKTFESGDVIGRYALTEFGGTKETGEPLWWATTENGNEGLVPESKLRRELRVAELTPAFVTGLSSKAYNELVKEVGYEEIDRVLNRAPNVATPSKEEQVQIARTWWETHPQVPRTRSNVAAFDDYLVKSPNASFDTAFADLFYKLELNPKAVGIDGFGEGIRGEAAIGRLTSGQIKQLQRKISVTAPVDFSKLSVEETVKEIGKLPITSEEFINWTKEADKAMGIEQPVPPLLTAAREKIWQNFSELHPDITLTGELKTKLLDLLKPHSPINPDSDEPLSVLNQHLDRGLVWLVQAGDPVVIWQESNIRTSGGSRWQINDSRPSSIIPRFDDSPVEITLSQINAMDGKSYAEKLLNPQFRLAVDRLMHKIGR